MHFSAALIIASLPLIWGQTTETEPSSPHNSSSTACTSTHIFLARGWNEPYPGRQESFVQELCTTLSPKTCSYEDIVYYSTFEANYCDSISEGVENGIKQLDAYNKRCPDAQLILSGYSQGAYVVGDMFAGGGGTFGDCVQKSNEGLDVESEAGKKVTAILLWGSKRHTASQSYNVFSGAKDNGTYPRPASELEALNQWASVLRDYCVTTDPNCAGGKVNEDHWNYFELYSDQGAEWVKSQVEKNATAASPAISGNSSVSGTSTGISSSSSGSTSTLGEESQSTAVPASATIQTSNSASTTSSAAVSATSTSSSGGVASTSLPLNFVGLAVAGSLAIYL